MYIYIDIYIYWSMPPCTLPTRTPACTSTCQTYVYSYICEYVYSCLCRAAFPRRARLCSGSEEGSYVRPIDFCITHLQARE